MSYLMMTSSQIMRYRLSDLLSSGNLFWRSFLRKALRCPIKISQERYTLKLIFLGPMQFQSSQLTGKKPGQLHLMIWYSMNRYQKECVSLKDFDYSFSIFKRFWSIYQEMVLVCIGFGVVLSYIICQIIQRSFDCGGLGHEANGAKLNGRLVGFYGVEVNEAFFDLLLQVQRRRYLFNLRMVTIRFFLGFVILTETFGIILLFIRTNNVQFTVDGVDMLQLDAFILHFQLREGQFRESQGTLRIKCTIGGQFD